MILREPSLCFLYVTLVTKSTLSVPFLLCIECPAPFIPTGETLSIIQMKHAMVIVMKQTTGLPRQCRFNIYATVINNVVEVDIEKVHSNGGRVHRDGVKTDVYATVQQ